MPRREWVWTRTRTPSRPPDLEKAAITLACEKFVAEVLKPRFLPAIRPSEFNYPVDLYGKWHGGRYRFIERFRSGHADSLRSEFEHAFARLDYHGRDLFDVMWHRHTGEWRSLHKDVSLVEALRLIEEDGLLHPV